VKGVARSLRLYRKGREPTAPKLQAVEHASS